MEINPNLKSVSWLIGSWLGSNGKLGYPTMKTLNYKEQLDITHPAPNQPVLHLNFVSWFENENGEKVKKHMESGYLKIKPQSDPEFFIYTSSHNNGIVLVEEGLFKDEKLVLNSIGITRSSLSKSPHVKNTRRVLEKNREQLNYQFSMSTSTNEGLDEHLKIVYEKVE